MWQAIVCASWASRAADYRMQHPSPSETSAPANKQQHRGTSVEYLVHGRTYEGYVSLPTQTNTSAPGVLVAHQWMGLGDYEKSRADEMAAQGYVAFALDVYGKGVRCQNHNVSCAQQTMKKAMANIPRLLDLVAAGSEQLLKAGAAKNRLVALGYCFGGSIVLELARHPGAGASAGVRYAAVSSVHGILAPLGKAAAVGEITGRVQAHHAELDFQGDGALSSLEAELKSGVNGTDGLWETLKYAKCEHGWTEPGSGVYRARAAIQAHKSTFEFFEMAIGEEQPEETPYPTMPFCRPPVGPVGGARSTPPASALSSPSPPQSALVEEFVFAASYLNSTRQWGKCLHVVIKYRYFPQQYLDYKPLRQEAIDLLVAPSAELPVNATWEAVNRELVRRFTRRHPVAAVISQVAVRHELNAAIDEPGTHGSVVSAGDRSMAAPSFRWVDAFAYDCTRTVAPRLGL